MLMKNMLITKYLLDKGSAIREHTSNFLFRDDHVLGFWGVFGCLKHL